MATNRGSRTGPELFGAFSSAPLHAEAQARLTGARTPVVWSSDRVLLGLCAQQLWLPYPRLELPTASGSHLAFLGRIDNRAELLARYNLPVTTCDDVLVLHAWRERGVDALELLVGEWALALYDDTRQRILLARDPVGTVPLYFTRLGAAIVFASDITTLLEYPGMVCEPDEQAVAEITVGAARLTPTQTFFRDVNALPPGELLLADASGVRRQEFWDFRPRNSGIKTFDDAAAALRVALCEAVTRRMRVSSSVGVQLSGGLDSSSICCLAALAHRELGAPTPIPFTYSAADGSAADELRFVELVDRATGLPTQRIDLAPIEFVLHARKSVAAAEAPFVSHTPGGFARLAQAACAQGAQVILNGGFGDQVTFPFPPGHFVDLFRSLQWSALWQQQRAIEEWSVDIDANVLRKQTLGVLLRAHTPRRVRDWRRRRHNPRPGAQLFSARLHELAAANGANGVSYKDLPQSARPLYETLRSPYKLRGLEAATKQATALGVTLSFPFLDRDVLQLLFSLPAELQYARGTPRALLRRGLAGIVPDAILARREKGDYTAPVRIDIARSTPAIVQEISDGLLMQRGLLDANAWRAQEKHWRANVDFAPDPFYLGDLYGLELWYRRFHSASSGGP